MWSSIQLVRYAERIPSHEHVIVQEYIDKPLLVDGFKCDLRIYVLVTSCNPLRVFLFSDGLLRMSTERYVAPSESNMVRRLRCYLCQRHMLQKPAPENWRRFLAPVFHASCKISGARNQHG